MNLKEKLPEKLQAEAKRALGSDAELRFSLISDLDLERQFGQAYLVVNDHHLAVLDKEHVILKLELDEIREIRVDELFGSSRLVAECDDKDVSLIYYTKTMVPQFGVLCRLVNQILRGLEPELPDEEEHGYCPRCKAPLPGRGSNCVLCVPRWAIFKRLTGLLKPFRGRTLIMVAATVLAVIANMVRPYVTKRIVDDVITAGQTDKLWFWVVLMLSASTLYLLARIAAGTLSSWLGARLVTNLRTRLHGKMQRLQMSYISKRGPGQLVGRIMHDTAQLQHFLIDGLPYILVNLLSFVIIAVILFRMDVMLTLLVFVPVPVLMFGAHLFWHRLGPLFHKSGSGVGQLHSVLNESISGIRVVKAFAQEKRRAQLFDEANIKLFGIRFSIEGTWIVFMEVMFWVMNLGVVAVWYFGAGRVLGGKLLSLGDLVAFVGYIWLLYGPLQWFTAVFNWMTSAFTGAERIFAVLDSPAEIEDDPDAVSLPEIEGRIEFDDVRFSYSKGKEILKGVSFEIEAGEMIGLVGKSGAGKSTIINLICRFYETDSGLVRIDGHDIRNIRLQELRQQMGMVLQEPFLFNASVMENIRYGRPGATFDDVVAAAKAAHAHEFILDTEYGYDTLLGDRGASLSGGEKQRISIARAILQDPAILILDEATSSVDSETEQYIQEAIARLVQGRTTIAIAHRLSTLRNADRLLVVDDGLIIETGTHDELMLQDGHYARLVKIQTELSKMKGEISD